MLKEVFQLFKTSKMIRLNLIVGSGTVLVYIMNKLFLREIFEWTFIHNYFNDVLAGILIVAIANVIAIVGSQRRLVLTSFVRILVFTFLCGVFWEYITPLYLSYSVSDPMDIVAYMFGGFLYWVIFLFYVGDAVI